MLGITIPRGEVERYHTAAVERRLEVETKPDASLVTDIDHVVNRRLRELVAIVTDSVDALAKDVAA